MRELVIIGTVLSCCAGCSTLPFQKTNYVSLEGINPEIVRAQFAQRLPHRLEVINSIVFAYRHLKISCLGPLYIDTLTQYIAVVGLNYVGVKLFELKCDQGAIDVTYLFPELATRNDFAKAVCEDIKKMYCDRIPPPGSKVILEKYKLIFRAPKSDGILEYVFAGRNNLLIEKSFSMDGHKLWSVAYYEYMVKKGKVFPQGIILRQYQYKYNLVVRLKEIRESE